MREYAGPTRQARHITFVPSDPPRLAAVTHLDARSGAVYLWRLDWPEPAVLSWATDADWSESLLAASPDGRWLVAGSVGRLLRWDLSTDPLTGPILLDLPPALASRVA